MGILSGVPILGDIIDAVKDLASEAIVDKDKRNEFNVELEKLRQAGDQRLHEQVLAQIEVNKEEAKSSNIFVSGWRPAVGWAGVAGLVYSAIIYPTAMFIANVSGYQGMLPALDDTTLVTILMGMLGVGAMRSYDRKQGTATDDFTTYPKKKKKGEPENILPPIYLSSGDLPEKTPWE